MYACMHIQLYLILTIVASYTARYDTVAMYELLADSHMTTIIYQIATYNMIPPATSVFSTNEVSW